MNSTELVTRVLKGEPMKRTPIYGWLKANMSEQIAARFGSVENFEDEYEFDVAHLFGGPGHIPEDMLKRIYAHETITPEMVLDSPYNDPNIMSDYDDVVRQLKHHKSRDRFCYLNTNGIFECLNFVFGIENHLMYMALYPDEMKEIYRRQAEWNRQFALNAIELGVDMIHISDDWGAQNALLFSPAMFRDMILPNHKIIADGVKSRGCFLSLHSDGNITQALDGICEIGYDVIHPFQESAGMSYQLYLDKYADKFGIMGGLCVQTTLGFGDYDRVEREIRRVFSLLKEKRWIFCTTHFVQDHCSVDELVFAYDLARKLAREE